MTPMLLLIEEIHRILIAEGDHPPLKVETLAKVLRCAVGLEPTPDELQRALAQLVRDGWAEILWRKGVPHYRIMREAQVGNG